MHIGCQTYSWEMQLAKKPTTLWQMFDAIAEAGYEGVEFTNNTAGAWLGEHVRVGEELRKRKLMLAAVAIARAGYTDPRTVEEDLAVVRTGIEMVRHFPGAVLTLTGAVHKDQVSWRKHLDQALQFYVRAAELAAAMGVRCAVHPHSHHGSLIQSREQYDHLFAHLPKEVGWCPDTGHIVRGGQDLMTCLAQYAERIIYVHMKDVDAQGRWKPMGEGIIDWPVLFKWLKKRDFAGWLVAEEESDMAWVDPVQANRQNREFLKKTI